MSKILEYVEFQAKKGVSHKEVIVALKETDELLLDINGFENRELAVAGDTFVEVVLWRDRESATKGLEKFKKDARSHSLFNLIDEATVNIKYLDII